MSRELLGTMMNDCFNHLGVNAVYIKSGSQPVNIRVLKFASDVEYETGDVDMVGERARFEVLIAEVAEPTEGDIIKIDGTSYQIIGLPLRDLDRQSWDIEGLVMA